MIVVLGRPAVAEGPAGPTPGGLAAAVALAIAALGSRVELVGTLNDDADGDAVALGLARAGVGHAALLRMPAARPGEPSDTTTRATPPLEAADVELGLRYLADFRVLIVADALAPEAAVSAGDAAAYSGAPIVIVQPPDSTTPTLAGSEVTVLEAPDDAQGPFAETVARYAVALEAGEPAAEALRQATEASGWEPVA